MKIDYLSTKESSLVVLFSASLQILEYNSYQFLWYLNVTIPDRSELRWKYVFDLKEFSANNALKEGKNRVIDIMTG